jgi:hypothetical protein
VIDRTSIRSAIKASDFIFDELPRPFANASMTRTLALISYLSLASAVSAQTSHDWQVVGSSGISDGIVLCCDIAVDGHNVVHVAYQDLNQPFAQASAQRFENGSWHYDGPKGAGSIGRAWYNQIAFDAQDDMYLASRDYGVGGKLNVRLYLRATDSWINVGPAGSSSGEAHYTALKVDGSGAPLTVFADRSTSPVDKATVLRFDFASGTWNPLGGFGVSASTTLYDCIGIDHANVPYIAYADTSHPDNSGLGKATVLRYDSANNRWVSVGPPGFTSTSGLNMWLEFDKHDVPYIVYQIYHSAFVVLRWNGTSWSQLGGSTSGGDHPDIETEPWRQWISLRFDSQNTPYVAYQMFDNGLKAAVRKFDGASWVPVGSLGFSAGQADYLSLAIDKSDVPWIAFRDGAVGQRLTVMRYMPATYTYCTASTSSSGCTADISASGSPSIADAAPFVVRANHVMNHHLGVLLYGTAPGQAPFGAGSLCIASPIKRAGAQDSGGNTSGIDCSGGLGLDFNVVLHAGVDPNLAVGQGVFVQYWYRDAQNPLGPGLSNALRFFVGL